MLILSEKSSIKYHYLLTDFLVGILVIFLPIYFRESANYNEVQIGTLYSVGALVAILSSLVNGSIAQKIKNSKNVLIFAAPVLFLGIFILYISTTFLISLIGLSCLFYLRTLLYIIGDDISINYLNLINDDNFGKYRSYGTIGWGFNFLITGYLISINPRYIFFSLIVISIMLTVNFFRLPTEMANKNMNTFKLKDSKKLLKYRNYILIVISFSLLWSTISNMQTYLNLTLIDLGGSVQVLATINASVLVVNFLIIRYSDKIRYFIGDKKFVYLLFFISALKYLFLSFVGNYQFIYVLAIFDPIILGLITPIMPILIKKEIPKNLSTIALTANNIMIMLVTSFFYQIYGYIYHNISFSIMYLLMFIIAVISLAITTRLKI